MKAQQKTVVVIAGPTAVGKTTIAVQLAKQWNTAIISADSRQCFRELNIGVARPSPEELAAVHHYFIASHSIQQKVTAADFEQYALKKTAALFEDKEVVIMVGGTGLYIKAFCEGMDAIPDVPEAVRQEIIENYNSNGLVWLQSQVQQLDPLFYKSGEIQNPHRLMRALEVIKATGKSIIHYRTGVKAARPFYIIKIGLELPRPELYARINHRVDDMMQHGLPEEVKSLQPFQHLNALQTVGYKELFEYLDGVTTLEAAIAAIKQNTRHYAKRQLTWFKKDANYTWFQPQSMEAIQSFIAKAIDQ